MKILRFDTKELAKQIGCDPELLYSEVCIVDNEISNDLSPNWDYTKAKIICTGFLYQDKICILLAEEDDEEELKQFLKKQLYDFCYLDNAHAFNKNMENGNFHGFIEDLEKYLDSRKISANFYYDELLFEFAREIKPFNAKGWNKDKFFQTLVDHKIIPRLNILDKFNGDGSKCIPAWFEYKKTNDYQHVMNIAQHNINCLIKECLIFKHKKFFLENYLIDKKGFMLRERTLEEKNV